MSDGFTPDPKAAALRTVVVAVVLTVTPMTSLHLPSAFRLPPLGPGLLAFALRFGLALRLRLSLHRRRLGVR